MLKACKKIQTVKVLMLCLVFVFTCITPFVPPDNIAHAATIIYVDDYGATPNDSEDDAPAIRKAVAAAAAIGNGAEVHFSSGKYIVDMAKKEWNFNTDGNLEGWDTTSQLSGSVSNGTLTLTINGSSSYMTSDECLDITSLYRLVKIRIKNNTASTQVKISWITSNDSTWDSNKSQTLYITASDTEYKEYCIDLSANSYWSDTIKQIRIHPAEGASSGTVQIDYIKAEFPKYIKWDFISDLEGWSITQQAAGQVSDSVLSLNVTGTEPIITSDDNLGVTDPDILLSTSRYRVLKLRLKNNTSATKCKVQWITTTDTTWDSNKSVELAIGSNMPDYSWYSTNLSISSYWTGTIKKIRIYPITGVSSGTVDIDFIGLTTDGAVSETYVGSEYHLKFENLNNIKLIGTSTTELEFQDNYCGQIYLDSPTDTAIMGLKLDYKVVPWQQVTIYNVDKTNGSFDFDIADSDNAFINDPRFWEIRINPGVLREPGNPTRVKTENSIDTFQVKKIERLDNDTWRYTVADMNKNAVGRQGDIENNTPVVLRIRGHGANGIYLNNGTNITLKDVYIYSTPGVAVVAHYGNGLTVDNLNVIRKDSSRWISSSADGIHYQNNRGALIVKNSTFQGLLDDALNLGAKAGYMYSVTSPTEFTYVLGSVEAPQVGDVLQVYDPINGEVRGTATVTSVTIITGVPDKAQVTVDTAIQNINSNYSDELKNNTDHVFNLNACGSGSIIQNNTFQDLRRFAILNKAHNTTIDNNSFSYVPSSAVRVANDPNFTEGPVPANVNITNNTFTHTCYAKYGRENDQAGAIQVAAKKYRFDISPYKGVKDILIEGNTIYQPTGNAINVWSVDGLTMRYNTITAQETDVLIPARYDTSGIKLYNVKNASVSNETITDPRPGISAGIIVKDAGTNVNINNVKISVAKEFGILWRDYMYHASSDFDSTQGASNWYYQQWDGSTYSDMAWNSSSNVWNGNYSLCKIGNDWQHPDTNDSVRKWVAPVNGTLKIKGIIKKYDTHLTGGDGVNLKILHNNTVLYDQDVAYNDNVGHSFELNREVSQNDSIYFRINQIGNNNYDRAYIDPEIIIDVYATSVAQYNAQSQFSGTQGQNNWYYKYWDGSSYHDMIYNSSSGYWQAPTAYGNYLRVFSYKQHPGSGGDSVRAWVAPETGEIIIRGRVYKENTNGGNGVIAKILHNTNVIFSKTLAYNDNVGYDIYITRQVEAGDTIYFHVDDNGNDNYDATVWSQNIVYKSIQ